MKEIEFHVRSGCNPANAEKVIERVCEERGLILALKGSLAKFPGSVHWHYKKEGRGTLELTLLRDGRRLWAKVQDGRKAKWIEDELPHVRKAIERKLRKRKS